ncbi:MAG TPA: ScyD/ScyE family protein [Ignavibacteriales bacterium]|nr:ScyD/ScyE family protein [Ignavibacteriales bacterium]
MKKQAIFMLFVLFLSSLVFYSCNDDSSIPTDTQLIKSSSSDKITSSNTTIDTIAVGLNGPRGLKFGADGYLYVAESGLGGSNSTLGQCDQVIPPVGPYVGGNTARILKISPSGTVSTVVDNLPSCQNALGDRLGVADIEFMNNTLYALIAGGGCSHGHSDVPASIIKINSDASWSVIADLSTYQQNNPVAEPEEDDFEPDGSWYSLINVRNNLYAIEPNHGEMVKVTKNGNVSRVIDFSATYGHIVPTSVAYHGNFFVGNLNTFPVVAGSSNIYKVTPSGQSQVWATGFSTVLGLVIDDQARMYVLESSSVDGFPTPNTGRIIKVLPSGQKEVLVDGLFFPTGMTMGPDGNLYVSNKGYGPPVPGFGEILRINLH